MKRTNLGPKHAVHDASAPDSEKQKTENLFDWCRRLRRHNGVATVFSIAVAWMMLAAMIYIVADRPENLLR